MAPEPTEQNGWGLCLKLNYITTPYFCLLQEWPIGDTDQDHR